MKNIDCHMLVLDTHPHESIRYTLTTYDNLVNIVLQEPVNLHILPGVWGKFLECRLNGLLYGTAQYVSFIDDDDMIIPGIFQQCVQFLDNNEHIGGVYTNSIVHNEDGTLRNFFKPHMWTVNRHVKISTPIHQLVVIRRDVLLEGIKILKNIHNFNDIIHVCTDQVIYTCCAIIKPWYYLDTLGYIWYNKLLGSHKNTPPNSAEYIINKQTIQFLNNKLSHVHTSRKNIPSNTSIKG